MPSNNMNEVVNLAPTQQSFSGWSTDQILSEVMEVKSLENKDYQRLIGEAFQSIDAQSTEDLRQIIVKLNKICHPSDTIVTVLNARLASMIATRND